MLGSDPQLGGGCMQALHLIWQVSQQPSSPTPEVLDGGAEVWEPDCRGLPPDTALEAIRLLPSPEGSDLAEEPASRRTPAWPPPPRRAGSTPAASAGGPGDSAARGWCPGPGDCQSSSSPPPLPADALPVSAAWAPDHHQHLTRLPIHICGD